MEGPPLVTRHSLDDEDVHGLGYSVGDGGNGSFSTTLLEPNVHDVMSMELAHHEMGGYLDPRSFGGGALGFDDYNGSSSLYDVNSAFGDDMSNEQKSLFGNEPVPFAQLNTNTQLKTSSRPEQHVAPVQNNKFDSSTVRFDQPRNVPTYPVKTADPSTCTQYAPVRTLLSSAMKPHGSAPSRRTASRSAQKKEAIDPKRVEDEVARNVSQILSATKQQRLAMEAQQRSGNVAPQPPRIAYACPDCHKTVTSTRNLQRHRQTCPARMGNGTTVMGTPSTVPTSSVPLCSSSTSVMISPTSSYSNLSYSNYNLSTDDQHYADWSRSNSYSAPQSVSSQHERCLNEPADQLGTLDPNSISCRLEDACFHPLSLDLDEPRALSSSGSTSSASTGTHSSGTMFICESCKKSVSSLRSLKRHHTTCKQYIAENGPPPDSDRTSTSQNSIAAAPCGGDFLTVAVMNSPVSPGLVKATSCSLPSSSSRITAVVTVIAAERGDTSYQFDPCANALPPQLPLVTSSSCRCSSLSDCICTPSSSPQQSLLWCVLSCILLFTQKICFFFTSKTASPEHSMILRD
ncbi:Zinc finger C2H2 type [Trichostrongylus colubriformis]|uniref:Zinc finger C2H2 type n=1 Tax=Trichostrongylus colubriformis TaxID=6319 RepID=A0AAN8FMM1_TRICO